MKPGRIENLARHFLYDYSAHVSQEYENLYRMETKLRELVLEARADALAEKLIGVKQIASTLLQDVAEKPSRLKRALELAEQQLAKEMQP